MGNDHDAEDALQEALVAVARGIRRFDGRSAFTTWSYRVATNACLDELRRRRRRPLPGALGGGDVPAAVPGAAAWAPQDPLSRHDGPGPAFGPGEEPGAAAIEAVGGRLDVDAALARIPYDFLVAVVLRDLCDLDYAEIAEALGIPPGTVRSRIARGRAQLARLLAEGTPGPGLKAA